jgi:hypothetical protein
MVNDPPAFTVAGDTLRDWMLGGVVSLPPTTVTAPSAVGGAGAEIVSWLPAASWAEIRPTVQVPEAAANGTVRVSCQIPSWGVPELSEKGPQVTGAD